MNFENYNENVTLLHSLQVMFPFYGFVGFSESAVTFSDLLRPPVGFLINQSEGREDKSLTLLFFSPISPVPLPSQTPVFCLSPISPSFVFLSSLRVSHQMSEIKSELDTLPMRAMLAAAFITYLSAAPEDRRRHCLETWMAQCGLQSEYTPIKT